MKTILALSLVIGSLAVFNTGCTASASVHKADASRVNSNVQVAYVASPSAR
jgi:hypothetical protein